MNGGSPFCNEVSLTAVSLASIRASRYNKHLFNSIIRAGAAMQPLVGIIMGSSSDWETLSAPVPGELVSLHFLFAGGAFNRDIPFDPACYFLGDEVAIGLRAFTSGYDVFHPHELIGWHRYPRDYRPTHWQDHHDWQAQEQRSLETLKILFTGRYLKSYGLCRERKLRDFEARLGLKLWDPG